MDTATFEQLLGPVGDSLLGEIRDSNDDALSLGTRLRRRYEPDLVAAAMSEAALRSRARTKFGADADVMWFTSDGLEQATRPPVAQYRARRLADAGVGSVTDLGCGIGGDLIAFARSGLEACGVEADDLRAAMARANLRALGLDGRVAPGDVETAHIERRDAVFCDPARRNERGRVFDLTQLSPSWELVSRLLHGSAAVKMLPGIAHEAVPRDVEAEWISHDGDLVEACLWGAGLSGTSRRATVLTRTGVASISARGAAGRTGAVSAWIAEPDDAVIRAGLVAELAEDVGAHLIDPHLAYLSADSPVLNSFARWYRVIDELPFGQKPLRAALAQRGIGTLTVKKRGVDIVPERLISRLRLRGPHAGTLILARIGSGARAFLVEPHA